MPELTYYRGDTWEGAEFTTAFDGSPPDDADSVAMQLRHSRNQNLVCDVEIQIDDAAEWVFSCPPQILDINTAGTWNWDVEVTYSTTRIKTIATGTMVVTNDVTRVTE